VLTQVKDGDFVLNYGQRISWRKLPFTCKVPLKLLSLRNRLRRDGIAPRMDRIELSKELPLKSSSSSLLNLEDSRFGSANKQ